MKVYESTAKFWNKKGIFGGSFNYPSAFGY